MDFVSTTDQQKKDMLRVIGAASTDALFETIPKDLRAKSFDLPEGLSEWDLTTRLAELARKNKNARELDSYLGAGAYDHFRPALIDALITRGEFLTAYTPYQPEASQGTLQAMFEYQTLIAELTALDVSNASLYEGGSAAAEAVLMALHATGRSKLIFSKTVHPEYREVVKTYLQGHPTAFVETAYAGVGTTDLKDLESALDDQTAAVIVQNPNFFGCVEEMEEIGRLAHAKGALFISIVNPVSLGLLAPPGEYGADIACGEGQALGNPTAYGGPNLGFIACKEAFVRRMPGRLVGLTKDTQGRRGFVLTLQAREQHIRREKATSNICTNQSLIALAAAIHLCYLGKEGIQELAQLCLQKAHYAQEKLAKLPGLSIPFSAPSFHEFVVKAKDAKAVSAKLSSQGIIGGVSLGRWYPELSDCLLFCVTETKSKAQLDRLAAALS